MALLHAATDPQTPDFFSMLKSLADALLVFWPLWLLIGIVGAAKFAYGLYRLRRLAKSGITEVDAMDGHRFEQFLATLFRRLGYRVEMTRYQGDYGADLIVTKEGVKTAVQAKRWSKRVGIKAVQEAVAAKGYYACDHALVVANRAFTDQAQRLARANEVTLWDRAVLVEKMLATRGVAERRARADEVLVEPPPHDLVDRVVPIAELTPTTATCATCGTTVSERVRDYCLSRPQRFRGLVYCFRHQCAVGPSLSASE